MWKWGVGAHSMLNSSCVEVTWLSLRHSPRTSAKGEGMETPDFWIVSTFLALDTSAGGLRSSSGPG